MTSPAKKPTQEPARKAGGRPALESDRKKSFLLRIRVSESLRDALEEYALSKGESVSVIVRGAITDVLKGESDDIREVINRWKR